MMQHLLKTLTIIDGIEVSTSSGFAERYFEAENYYNLPSDYMDFLSSFNGVSGYYGYIRVYGINTSKHIDVLSWNRFDTWKFAWCRKVSGYFCIAGDAFGGQYAYAIEDGKLGEKIYMLDAYTMDVQFNFDSFEDFFEREFLRVCKEPYDQFMIAARKKFGEVATLNQFIYSPSLHLGGQENIGNLVEMEAKTAMIVNGDIYTQIFSSRESAVLESMSQYVDELGRRRVKLNFLT